MQNIFKTIFRNFIRKPITNLINLFGLAVSLTLVIILSAYCYSELSTDNYHENGDRVYLYGNLNKSIYTPAILKGQIDLNVPEVESTVRLSGAWEAPVFQVGNHDPITSNIVFTDEDFFKLFTYQSIEGNLETSLKEPMTVVITKTLADKLFGKESALGKTIKLNNNRNLTVTAVIKESDANSSISFSAITSIATRKIVQPNEGEFTEWGWCNYQTFILLKKGTEAKEAAKKILVLYPERDRKNNSDFKLNPFKQLYFSQYKALGNDYIYLRNGNKHKILILVMVAMLVLIIALVNFINISSSQWIEKIRQIGVMKVLGATRFSILQQVLSESFLLFLMALCLAFILVIFISPLIRNYTGIQFNQQILYTPLFLFISTSGTFILSIIFSIIPALRISKSKAVDNLKKRIKSRSSNSFSRGILVTAQFIIAIVLIAFTVLVQKQINFGSNSFSINNKETIIGIKLTPQLNDKKDILKKLLQEKPDIKKVSFTEYYPGKPMSHWGIQQTINNEIKQLNFDTFNADANFVEMIGLQLIQGRFFSDKFTTDEHTMVVNETFLRENKIENPIGMKIFMGMNSYSHEIIGVVKDFHYKSINEPIVSLAIQNETKSTYCLVSLNTKDFNSLNKVIQEIKISTTDLSPFFPIEISFLDQAIDKMYQSELQFSRTFSLFALCAIVICCLGILAMSLFSCQQRIKEIGIRKVNGAKISEVIILLNKDFIKWVAIAFVIAIPIAYYAMLKWLESFAYKTELNWWIFVLAGFIAFVIAILTVSWQSYKAATRNPVEALRYE